MSPSGGRDVLVVLREELAAAQARVREADMLRDDEIAFAAKKLVDSASALDTRIRVQFDQLLLDRAAAQFRAAAKLLASLLDDRRRRRRHEPDVQRVLKRLCAHAREIARLTEKSGPAPLAAAMEAMALESAWNERALDAVVHLVDTLLYLARVRLGDHAGDDQLSSLIDRAASTAMVTSLHALRDAAKSGSATLLKDRYQLAATLKSASASVVERLTAWFKLDDKGNVRLQQTVEQFADSLVDRLAAPAAGSKKR